MAERPVLISLISMVTMLAAVAFFVVAVLCLVQSDIAVDAFSDGHGGSDPFMILIGIAFLVLGIVTFIVGYGMWKGISIFWYVAVLLYVFGFVASLLLFPVGLVLALVCVLILLYLFQPKVRNFFRI